MSKRSQSLFDVIVPEERLHFNYKMTRESGIFEPARWMFDDVFAEYNDKDGNFLEQFQTQGFDARVHSTRLKISGFDITT